jgi:hypothetical protein
MDILPCGEAEQTILEIYVIQNISGIFLIMNIFKILVVLQIHKINKNRR